MARKKVDFTVEDVHKDVVDMFNWLVVSFGSIGIDILDFALIASGVDSNELETSPTLNSIQNLMQNQKAFTLESVTKNFGNFVYDIAETYEYAANATTWNYNHMMDCLAGMDMLCCEGISPFEGWFNRNPDSKIDFLYQLAYARKSLDEDHDLNISTLALLAGVDERTIRNAASSGAFEIKKSGSSTMISNAEARRWLNTRPDFKATKYEENSINCFSIDRYHYSATGFGQFLALNRKEQNLTIEQVAQEIGVETDVLIDLEKGIDRIHLSQISKLQNILKIEGNKLLNDYMEIFHYEELSNLKHLFQAEFESKPKSVAKEKKLQMVK